MSEFRKYLNYLIKNCYEEDHDPNEAETWRDNYCYEMSFSEWYFKYRKRWHLNPKKEGQFRDKCFSDKYKHTPENPIVGSDIFESGFILY